MTPLLQVDGLQIRYPRGGWTSSWVEVVMGVSFEIRRGETLAIVGESGSGKTSLAMALMGLASAHKGRVLYNGEEVLRDARERLQPDRRRVVLMFQDATGSLSPRMNVRSQLLEPFEIHSMDKGDRDQRVNRLLDAVGLSERLADAYPHELSGGQARRVGIARALALEPDLIIADEPTAGLDVSIQGGVLNLLSSLQERMGLSMMIVTHNLNIVRHVADRMAIMYLGRFVEQGPSAELLDQPRHPYTRALLSANPSPDPDAVGERLELAGEVPSLLARPNGCEFHTRCPIVQSDCRETAPTVRQTGDGHRFSCHHPMTDSPLLDD